MKNKLSLILSMALLSAPSFGHDSPKKHRHSDQDHNNEASIEWLDESGQVVDSKELAADISSGYVNQGSSRSLPGSNCHSKLFLPRTKLQSARSAPVPPAAPGAPAVHPGLPFVQELQLQMRCRQYEIAAQTVGNDIQDGPTKAVSQDGKIQCLKYGGQTIDWKSCKSGLDAYNMIVVADAALDVSQRMRTQQNNERMNQEFAARSAQGDNQNAALDATIQTNNSLSGMNQEKAAAYMAAVGLLGSKISSWQGNSDGALNSLCGNIEPLPKPVDESLQASTPSLKVQLIPMPGSCLEALKAIKGSNEVFANGGAKASLIAAFMQYMQKAVAAGMAAKNLANIAKRVEQVKQGTESPDAPTFDRCVVAPNDPSCLQPGSIVPGQEYTGGNFSVDGLGNNVFGLDTLENQDLKLDDPNNLTPVKIGDAGSPFVDKAKEADGIMDPAPVASTQPGAAPTAGAGGGGGGSGGGGGGVSLGNDLAGPEAEKPTDVKANQVGGAYNFTGGQGFKAIAATKDENPFSSLFDSKSQGGLEEDRSIASDDIGGKDSGLFKRISTRYGKVQSDKRIEALNLE